MFFGDLAPLPHSIRNSEQQVADTTWSPCASTPFSCLDVGRMTATSRMYISQSIEQNLTPPETPPDLKRELQIVHPWPEPETAPEETSRAKRRKTKSDVSQDVDDFNVPHQDVLLLHGPKQRYAHTTKQPIPSLENDREMLIAVEVVGLNPIDWKAPDFGFGLPTLPCISGRDLAGCIVKAPTAASRFRRGDTVMAISTDYRDSRKSAYQQYAVVSDFNACRLPRHVSAESAAPLGVAFAAAALGLGICLGMDFSKPKKGPRGPDLLGTIRALSPDSLAKDIRAECFDGIRTDERAMAGDWIAIWGGSSATGCCAVQLAKLCGLRVIAVIDVARSGERMLKHGADLLVDRLDPQRAVQIVKGITKGTLRFGLDTRGKETAQLLADCMRTECGGSEMRGHVVGLTGIPKEPAAGIAYHTVPIKAFHEARQVGEGLMIWLEKLFEQRLITTPDIEVAAGGLAGINAALDRLRDGSVNGPRIVVPLTT